MTEIRQSKPTVSVPATLLEQLKREVYTIGTPVWQVASESGLSVATIKSVLAGNRVEQETVARLNAYVAALARNAFYDSRKPQHSPSQFTRLDRLYYAYNKELWQVYHVTSIRPVEFAKLDHRLKVLQLKKCDLDAKQQLINAYKPHIERHRVWLPDSWSYFRCKHFLREKLAALGVKN